MFLIILIAGIKHVEMTQHMCSGLRISFLGLGAGRTQGERSGGLAFIPHPLSAPISHPNAATFFLPLLCLRAPPPFPFSLLVLLALQFHPGCTGHGHIHMHLDS